MNTSHLFRKLSIAIALVALFSTGAIWEIRRVRAVAPPEPGRFGMVGITHGQTMRLNIVNLTSPPDPERQHPPDPCRVVLGFRNAQGQPIRNSDGQVIRGEVSLQPGESAFLDLNGDMFGGPSTNADASMRTQLRPFVRVLQAPPEPDRGGAPPDPCFSSAEVFDNTTLRTSFVLPGVESMERPEGHNHNETLLRDSQSPRR